MIVLIKEEGRKTTVTVNGHSVEHKTSFLKSLSYKDFLTWVVSESKKAS